MPSGRQHCVSKFHPAFIFGAVCEDDIAPLAVVPGHLDRGYVENTFGVGAAGVLRQIQRIWVADGRLFSEETDNF